MLRTFPWLLLLSAGCTRIDEVVVRGEVERLRDSRDDWPLVGGTVTIADALGEVYDEDTTDAGGAFVAIAPAGQTIFAAIAGEGLGVASFTGISGLQTTLEVGAGTLFGIHTSEIAALRDTFGDCPGVNDDGGVAFGEVRVYGLSDPETGESPLVTTANIRVTDDAGAEYTACYLNADGTAHDPAATVTGDMGFFAVFGLPTGVSTMQTSYTAFEDETYDYFQPIWVPDGADVVVPRFPAYVEFPY